MIINDLYAGITLRSAYLACFALWRFSRCVICSVLSERKALYIDTYGQCETKELACLILDSAIVTQTAIHGTESCLPQINVRTTRPSRTRIGDIPRGGDPVNGTLHCRFPSRLRVDRAKLRRDHLLQKPSHGSTLSPGKPEQTKVVSRFELRQLW